jgi:hypothetical protein
MLYRATNKNNSSRWVIADSHDEAISICIERGFVRDKKNCTLQLGDKEDPSFYDYFKRSGNDLTEVDNKKGLGCVLIGNGKSKWKVG